MLGKAMLTMNRSSDDRKTPVSTMREVTVALGSFGRTRGGVVSTVMKRTVTKKVS
jgi:hypothetical protein